jgi:hypothetical protein
MNIISEINKKVYYFKKNCLQWIGFVSELFSSSFVDLLHLMASNQRGAAFKT